MLNADDQSDLHRYFRLGYFFKSTCGPMLDRAELFSLPSEARRSKEPITARPTAEVKIQPKAEPRSEDLELFGRVSRRLSRVARRHALALEAYYGDAGSGAALRSPRYGAIVSLFPLLKAWPEIAKRERKGSKLELTDQEIAQNLASRRESGADDKGEVAALVMLAERLKNAAEREYEEVL